MTPEELAKGDPGKCRSCGTPVVFVYNPKSGKAPPYNPADIVLEGKLFPAGTSHFATCPQAPEWRGRARK